MAARQLDWGCAIIMKRKHIIFYLIGLPGTECTIGRPFSNFHFAQHYLISRIFLLKYVKLLSKLASDCRCSVQHVPGRVFEIVRHITRRMRDCVYISLQPHPNGLRPHNYVMVGTRLVHVHIEL